VVGFQPSLGTRTFAALVVPEKDLTEKRNKDGFLSLTFLSLELDVNKRGIKNSKSLFITS